MFQSIKQYNFHNKTILKKTNKNNTISTISLKIYYNHGLQYHKYQMMELSSYFLAFKQLYDTFQNTPQGVSTTSDVYSLKLHDT